MQKKALFAVLLTLAVVTAGTILFLAQVNTFGQAQNGAISGMIVLRDSDTAKPLTVSVSLPGTSCSVKGTNCNGEFLLSDGSQNQYFGSATTINFEELTVSSKTFEKVISYNCNTCIPFEGIAYNFSVKTNNDKFLLLGTMDDDFEKVFCAILNQTAGPGGTQCDQPSQLYTATHIQVTSDVPGAEKYKFTITPTDHYNKTPVTIPCPYACDGLPNPWPVEEEFAYVIFDPTSNEYKGGFDPQQGGVQQTTLNCRYMDISGVPGGTYIVDAEDSYQLSIAYQCT